jgi:hypothetical protein
VSALPSRRLVLPATFATLAFLVGFIFAVPVAAEPVGLSADLRGSHATPGPGDPDGAGSASITIDATAGSVCFSLSYEKIAEPYAAHIHAGAPGTGGDIVVELEASASESEMNGCIEGLSTPTLQAIADGPADHYVDVHTDDFPEGAIRGQLSGEPGAVPAVVPTPVPEPVQDMPSGALPPPAGEADVPNTALEVNHAPFVGGVTLLAGILFHAGLTRALALRRPRA